ncbi:MAG: tetratricopeptide repeat protein [Flavobacteriales bacterium]|nr:tetratricopeptide repeat protein [Flavobacteriales bacterium]
MKLTPLFVLLLLALCGTRTSFAQKAEDALRKGNEYYRKGDHVAAGQAYQQANTADPNDMRATFNLGDAEYKQGKFPEAQQQFEQSALRSKDPVEQARAYHNIGNSWLGQKKPEEAIKAYREALRRDPSDEDTRYNLAYAQRMLQQQHSSNRTIRIRTRTRTTKRRTSNRRRKIKRNRRSRKRKTRNRSKTKSRSRINRRKAIPNRPSK